MRKRLWLFGLFFLIGYCSSGCRPFWAKPIIRVQALNAEIDGAVVQAFNDRCGRVFLELVDRDAPFDVKVDFSDSLPPGVAGTTNLVPGLAGDILTARIRLHSGLRHSRFYLAVYAHELIHALGLVEHLPKSDVFSSHLRVGHEIDQQSLTRDLVFNRVCEIFSEATH